MSDRDDAPSDVFDVVCRLDDIIDALKSWGYYHEAEHLQEGSRMLTSQIRISLAPEAGGPPEGVR